MLQDFATATRHIPQCISRIYILHSIDAVDVDAAISDFGDAVDTYVDAGPCTLGQPSTIVWLMDKQVEIVRQGAIPVDKIKEVLEC